MQEIENIEYQKKLILYIVNGYTAKEIAAEIGGGVNKKSIEYNLDILKKRYMAKNLYVLVGIFFRRKLIK